MEFYSLEQFEAHFRSIHDKGGLERPGLADVLDRYGLLLTVFLNQNPQFSGGIVRGNDKLFADAGALDSGLTQPGITGSVRHAASMAHLTGKEKCKNEADDSISVVPRHDSSTSKITPPLPAQDMGHIQPHGIATESEAVTPLLACAATLETSSREHSTTNPTPSASTCATELQNCGSPRQSIPQRDNQYDHRRNRWSVSPSPPHPIRDMPRASQNHPSQHTQSSKRKRGTSRQHSNARGASNAMRNDSAYEDLPSKLA